jgi:hypothetical protein
MIMKQGQIGMTLDVAGYETAMEDEDMRAVVLTLDRGQTVSWHYHSTITDSFVCLRGPMVVETRAPRNTYVLNAGRRRRHTMFMDWTAGHASLSCCRVLASTTTCGSVAQETDRAGRGTSTSAMTTIRGDA